MEDKSLIIIFGECGKGKSSLAVHFADEYIKKQGTERWELSEYVIRGLNANRKKPLKYPDRPIIYSNLSCTLKDKKGREITPVAVKGKDIGINDDEEKNYKYFVPASFVVIDEAQNEFVSKSEHLQKGQRRFLYERRHNRLKLVFISPRAALIHKDIRRTGAYGIEVLRQEHEYSEFGTLIKTKWYCREFVDENELELYIQSDGNAGRYIKTVYEHKGDIFALYDSYSFVGDFAPPEGEEYLV